MKTYLFIPAIALFLASCTTSNPAGSPPASSQATLQVVCELNRTGDNYRGTCEVPCSVNALAVNFVGLDEKRACSSPSRTVNASLAKTAVPNRWLGTMVGVQPEDPTRLEVVPNKNASGSIARMPYGWFRVMQFEQNEQRVKLAVNASSQVRPDADDIAIINRAKNLLANESIWNKEDNRQCPAGQSKLSLFCALTQATTEISGGVHYRQPAMQAVREELNLVDPERIKTHRIMDYNNHPKTTLAEIQSLLDRARARVEKQR